LQNSSIDSMSWILHLAISRLLDSILSRGVSMVAVITGYLNDGGNQKS
jgi:hypothetical protein